MSSELKYLRKFTPGFHQELRMICNALGLAYPQHVPELLRNHIVDFDYEYGSPRVQTTIAQLKAEFGDKSISELALAGAFQLSVLFRLRNVGATTIMDILRDGLDVNGAHRARYTHSESAPPKRKLPPEIATSNPEAFRALTAKECGMLLRLNSRIQSELESRCVQNGLEYPREVDRVIRQLVFCPSPSECPVRARNVILIALDRRNLNWDEHGFRILADENFFGIKQIHATRNLGLKSMNDLFMVFINGAAPLPVHLKEQDEPTNQASARVSRIVRSKLTLTLFRLLRIDIASDIGFITNGKGLYDSICVTLQALLNSNAPTDDEYFQKVLNRYKDHSPISASVAFLRDVHEALEPDKSKLDQAERNLYHLIDHCLGASLADMSEQLNLSRERCRQILKATQKKLAYDPTGRSVRKVLKAMAESPESGVAIDSDLILLGAFFGLKIVKPTPNEQAVKQLKNLLRSSPTLTVEDLNASLEQLNLAAHLDHPDVYSKLKVAITRKKEHEIIDLLERSAFPLSVPGIAAQLSHHRQSEVLDAVRSLIKHKAIFPIGKRGLYTTAKLNTALNGDNTSYAGFTLWQLNQEQDQVHFFSDVIDAYVIHTNVYADRYSFMQSLALSPQMSASGWRIFCGRIFVHETGNAEVFEQFNSYNFAGIRATFRGLNITGLTLGQAKAHARHYSRKKRLPMTIGNHYAKSIWLEAQRSRSEWADALPEEIHQALSNRFQEAESHPNLLQFVSELLSEFNLLHRPEQAYELIRCWEKNGD